MRPRRQLLVVAPTIVYRLQQDGLAAFEILLNSRVSIHARQVQERERHTFCLLVNFLVQPDFLVLNCLFSLLNLFGLSSKALEIPCGGLGNKSDVMSDFWYACGIRGWGPRSDRNLR